MEKGFRKEDLSKRAKKGGRAEIPPGKAGSRKSCLPGHAHGSHDHGEKPRRKATAKSPVEYPAALVYNHWYRDAVNLVKEAIQMVKLIVGQKGTGKTKKMIALANERIEKSDGSVVFINKNHRLMYDLKYMIRVVCMEDYEEITNSDEYIGFIFGIISSDHDIEAIFIDSILKHADVSMEDIPEFLERLSNIGDKYDIEFIVSLSASPDDMGADISGFEVLNEVDLEAS
jgi:hypothetical protein